MWILLKEYIHLLMEQELSGNGEVRAAVMEKKMTKYTPCYKNSDHISSRYFVGLLCVFFLVGGWETRHLANFGQCEKEFDYDSLPW